MRAALLRLIAASGAPPTDFALWVDAAAARGPTPSFGPLRHDLLLGRGVFGLTLFADGRDPALEALAIEDARRWGEPGTAGVAALLAAGARTDARHAGLRWTREGGCTLKLYRSGSVLTGVDYSDHGPHRRRSYRQVAPPQALDSTSLNGYSHTIEARLEPGAAVDGVGKTTTAVIFGPDAPVSALDVAAGRLRPGSSPWADVPAVAQSPDLEKLRAAALELDRYDDGRESFDVLVTFGE